MKLKDRVIRKLLDVGKKHKILVYPTLALVAIVSAISHAFYWGKGNGKKLIASILVMAMLVTQSLFLTSSADNADTATVDEATATDAQEIEAIDMMAYEDEGVDESDSPIAPGKVFIYRLDENNVAHLIGERSTTETAEGSGVYQVIVPTNADIAAMMGDNESYFHFSGLSTNANFTQAVPDDGIIDSDWTLDSADGTYKIFVKADRVVYPVKIMDGETVVGTDTITFLSPTTGCINPEVTYTVKNASDYGIAAYKWGYNFSGVKYGGSGYGCGTTTPTISPSVDTKEIVLEAQWTAMPITYTLDVKPTGTPSEVKVVSGQTSTKTFDTTFDSDITLPFDDYVDSWAGNEAYYVSGWKINGVVYGPDDIVTGETLSEHKASVDIDPEVEDRTNVVGVKAEAIWTYKDVRLKAENSGDGTVTASEGGLTISGEYGDTINTVISAEYIHDTAVGTKFSYLMTTDDINVLGKYGIAVTTSSDGGKIVSYTLSGTLNDTTAGESVNLEVTDDNKDESKTSNHSVTLVVNPRDVGIDPKSIQNASKNGAPSKSYDGVATIPVDINGKVDDKGDSSDSDADIYVEFDAVADLADANAGTGKQITLRNATLKGSKADKYTLKADANVIDNAAEVIRMPITVTTQLREGQSDSILFGQENPEYTLRVADTSKLSVADQAEYNACTSDAAYMSFMTNKLGFAQWDVPRTAYSPIGTYTISPTFVDTNSNYTVSSTGLSKQFNVGREDGVKDTNYCLSTEKGSNGYYPGLKITPTGNYDKIRLISDGEGDIVVGMDKTDVEAKFDSTYIELPDMTDKTIKFQMLNSGTGAITNIVTMTNVSVDTTPPKFYGFTVSPGTSYFNDLHFGSYYHGKDVNGSFVSNATINVVYKTDDSVCKTLCYYFADENGNPKSVIVSEVKMNSLGGGMFGANITIGTGASGQLVVYAIDETGNTSGSTKIKMTEALDFVKEDQNSSNYYEWMVENSIESATINVTDMSGNSISTDAGENVVWYNGIRCSVAAVDEESGVNKIVWVVTNPDGVTSSFQQEVSSTDAVRKKDYGKVLEYNFNKVLKDENLPVGAYKVDATLYDNAGNNIALNQVGPFYIDCKPPVITDKSPVSSTGYLSGAVLLVDVTEGEEESGVANVKLYTKAAYDAKEAPLKTWDDGEDYTYDITSNGDYVVVATDNAGNTSVFNRNFTGISDVIPDSPVITIEGTEGSNDWYVDTMPTIRITSELKTSDGVPVDTFYRVTYPNGNVVEKTVTGADYTVELNKQGDVLIEAWSISKSNCKSEIAKKNVKIDIDAPDVQITESSIDESGKLVVNFKAEDTVSGVDPDSVTVSGSVVKLEEKDGSMVGSFTADSKTTYDIVVKDMAGNIEDSISFVPLELEVSPVTQISANSANLDAKVLEGTNPIDDCYIAYKKHGDATYQKALAKKTNESYGVAMNYTFKNLSKDTVYDYKVYAITKVSKEVKSFEGSFRTTDGSSIGSVRGSVKYSEDLADGLKTYPIYVSLYDANTYIATKEIESPSDLSYTFTNLKDGSYRVVASNGMLKETASVEIANGGILYPSDYLSNNGINFTLDGLSTEVVIEDDAINLTADGLGKIYNTALYNGNVTDEDMDVVEHGGTVKITLYASYMDSSAVDGSVDKMFKNNLPKNAEIKKYIEIHIVKEVRDENGVLVNGTPTIINRLAEPITLAFPLGELAGCRVGVASVHNEGTSDSFNNWGASEASVSAGYVTIKSDVFSIYALYVLHEEEKEYTVKWLDGNGKTLKTEVVKGGTAATPPDVIPTKAASDKYTYTFSGWDTDYSNIIKDTVISAWFTANKKTNDKDDKKDPNKAPEADITNPTNNNSHTTVTPVAYTYMGSADSPRTGDETPIVLLVIMMFASLTGMVVIRKKNKE